MAKREIIIAPDPRLKRSAEAVAAVDDEIRILMDDMLETMYAAPGVGLAAPQVGVLHRVIVVDCARNGVPADPHMLVNPEIVWCSDDSRVHEEGCLSLPDQFAEVIRPDRIKVAYLDRDNQACELEAEGLLSTCIQHEMDHLDGVLFVDYLSKLRRDMILRKLTKLYKPKPSGARAGAAVS